MFQGSSAVNASRGMGSVEAMKLLGIDASVIGNHEFDYGGADGHPDALRGALTSAISASPFFLLSANISGGSPESEWPPSGLKPWVIIERAGYRIGVIGLTTRDTPTTTVPERVKDLVFADPSEVLVRELPLMDAEGVDFVVVLGHLTGTCNASEGEAPCEFDGEIGEILGLPDSVLERVGLMITGHSHKPMIEKRRGIWVLQSHSSGRSLTRTRLVSNSSGQLIVEEKPVRWYLEHASADPGCEGGEFPMTALEVGGVELAPSRAALDLIDSLEAANPRPSCEILGCASGAILRSSDSESALGDMVTDILRDAFPGAVAGIQNSGGLRVDILKERLSREDVESIMPFENYAYLVEMPGFDLRRLLQISGTGKHGILQVSGIEYSIARGCNNPSDITGDGVVEPWENDCLCDVKVGGSDLDPSAVYPVVVNSFLYDGGDSMVGIFDRSRILERGPVIKSVIESYVSGKDGCVKASDYYDEARPRIRIVDGCGDSKLLP